MTTTAPPPVPALRAAPAAARARAIWQQRPGAPTAWPFAAAPTAVAERVRTAIASLAGVPNVVPGKDGWYL